MNLKELLAKQQEIIERAKAEGARSLTVEEQKEFEDLQRQIDELQKQSNQSQSSSGTQQQRSHTNNEDSQRAVGLERQRVSEINTLCRKFDLDATPFIENGDEVDKVRQHILEELTKEKAPVQTGVKVGGDLADDFRSDAAASLMLRSGLQPKNATTGAERLRHMSLESLARESARISGSTDAHLLAPDDLMRQHITSNSLFAGIMDLTAHQVFEKAYTEAETTYQKWVKTGTLRDFRPTETFQVGTAGELLLVPENGELKHDDPYAEKGPVRQLLTFGRQFTMSRQTFINNDTDFITTLPMLYAQSARMGINRLVYQLLKANPAIWDGKKLFEHGNVSSVNGKPSIESIADMRRLMRKQKAVGGEVAMNISPKYMILPTTLEVDAWRLMGSPSDPTQSNASVINPFQGQFEVITDPELDGDPGSSGEKEWYMAADKLRSPIQVDFLNGVDMPTITLKEPPAGQLGLVWDIYIDYGVSIVDYKTVVKNNGQ